MDFSGELSIIALSLILQGAVCAYPAQALEASLSGSRWPPSIEAWKESGFRQLQLPTPGDSIMIQRELDRDWRIVTGAPFSPPEFPQSVIAREGLSSADIYIRNMNQMRDAIEQKGLIDGAKLYWNSQKTGGFWDYKSFVPEGSPGRQRLDDIGYFNGELVGEEHPLLNQQIISLGFGAYKLGTTLKEYAQGQPATYYGTPWSTYNGNRPVEMIWSDMAHEYRDKGGFVADFVDAGNRESADLRLILRSIYKRTAEQEFAKRVELRKAEALSKDHWEYELMLKEQQRRKAEADREAKAERQNAEEQRKAAADMQAQTREKAERDREFSGRPYPSASPTEFPSPTPSSSPWSPRPITPSSSPFWIPDAPTQPPLYSTPYYSTHNQTGEGPDDGCCDTGMP